MYAHVHMYKLLHNNYMMRVKKKKKTKKGTKRTKGGVGKIHPPNKQPPSPPPNKNKLKEKENEGKKERNKEQGTDLFCI